MPGFHAEALVERLRRRLDRLGEPLYGLVLWTRHPAALLSPPLRAVLETEVDNVVLNLTITGLGATELEPGVPATAEVLAPLAEVIELLRGEPGRLRWRFDPLIYRRNGLELFRQLAAPMADLGVPTVTVSFPSSMSLAGSLLPRYRAAGIEPWPGIAAKVAFATELVAGARERGLRALACCQPKVTGRVEGLERAQCIPLEVLTELHPRGLPFERRKDASQRRHCACPPSEDIGDYDLDRCRSGCAYCYSRAGGPLTPLRADSPG